MNDKFLLVSLEEKKAKKIAEVINNDTCRKILDHLAQKESTESDISRDLGIPISTVHYNLKQLVDSNLVVVEEFHYSKKGKEINHYSLANKYIIIAPKSESASFMDALKKVLPLVAITAVVGTIMQIMNIFKSGNAAQKVADINQPMMTGVATTASSNSAEAIRPVLQSYPVAFFLIGAFIVILIYFFYELTRKR